MHYVFHLIGLTDRKVEGDFVWIDCTLPSGQWSLPSDNTEERDCVILDSTSDPMITKNCSAEYGYVCEYRDGKK